MPLTPEERLKRAKIVLENASSPEDRATAKKRIAEAEQEQEKPIAVQQPPSTNQQPPTPREPWNAFNDVVAAPYRFVPLNATVVGPEQGETPLDELRDGHGSATLTVTWGIETPLLIGKEESEGSTAVVPMSIGKTDEKRYVIPGATLRGLVRSSLEIIAFARLRQVNDHFRFGVRDFTHARYRNENESPVSNDSLVRAGWLKKIGDGYTITPCADDGNRWGYVKIKDLPGVGTRVDWVRKPRSAKLVSLGTTAFLPKRPRDLGNGRTGRMVYRPVDVGDKGEFVVSGAPPVARKKDQNGNVYYETSKRFEFVLFPDEEAAGTAVQPSAWRQFELMNSRQGRRGLEPEGAWAELKKLVDSRQRVPVFWVGSLATQQDGFAFGLTRTFKIPHAESVGDKVPKHLRAKLVDGRPEIDFVENLFGHVYERQELTNPESGEPPPNAVARKSRVAFGFAAPVDATAFRLWPTQEAPHETIMMAPRASYGPYYLTGREKDWSSKEAKLAGRKRYPPRYQADKLDVAPKELAERLKDPIERFWIAARKPPEEKVKTRLRFLEPTRTDAAFKSAIKLHNVSEVELGAVLWALTFGNDTHGLHRHMLGRAKGMGAGQTAVRKIEIRWKPQAAPQHTEETSWPEPSPDGLAARLMRAFEDYMEKATEQAWRDSETLRDYRALHRPGTWTALAGQLAAAMGATLSTREERTHARFTADYPLATSFLHRPGEREAKKRNDFQRIRDATKRAFDGWRPPDPAVPDRLLTIPRKEPIEEQ